MSMKGFRLAVYILSFIMQFFNIQVCKISLTQFPGQSYLYHAYVYSGVSMILYLVLFVFSCCVTNASGKAHLIALMFVVMLQLGIASAFVSYKGVLAQHSGSFYSISNSNVYDNISKGTLVAIIIDFVLCFAGGVFFLIEMIVNSDQRNPLNPQYQEQQPQAQFQSQVQQFGKNIQNCHNLGNPHQKQLQQASQKSLSQQSMGSADHI